MTNFNRKTLNFHDFCIEKSENFEIFHLKLFFSPFFLLVID